MGGRPARWGSCAGADLGVVGVPWENAGHGNDDRSGTASRPDPATFNAWAGDQRIFVSSVIAPLAELRRSLALTITEIGAQPVWFEDFGGRADDAEVAYLGEIASSTIYLGILGRDYGRLDKAHRLSATHAEYREAERLGLPISAWVRDEANMNADQFNFLSEVRLFHTTGNFTDAEDLARGVRRRLEELAAEAVSPWAKLADVVFRTRRIVDDGVAITIHGSVHDGQVVAALEAMRPNTFRNQDVRLTWAGRSAAVRVAQVQTTTTASRSHQVEVIVKRVESRESGSIPMTASFSTGGRSYTSDDLAVLDVRHMLFGEERPQGLFSLGGSIRDFVQDLPTGPTPAALYQAVFALLATEALVESGRALRVHTAQVSPVGPDGRRVRLAWTGHTDRGANAPTTVELEGVMQ
jgi:hypothetical protein